MQKYKYRNTVFAFAIQYIFRFKIQLFSVVFKWLRMSVLVNVVSTSDLTSGAGQLAKQPPLKSPSLDKAWILHLKKTKQHDQHSFEIKLCKKVRSKSQIYTDVVIKFDPTPTQLHHLSPLYLTRLFFLRRALFICTNTIAPKKRQQAWYCTYLSENGFSVNELSYP